MPRRIFSPSSNPPVSQFLKLRADTPIEARNLLGAAEDLVEAAERYLELTNKTSSIGEQRLRESPHCHLRLQDREAAAGAGVGVVVLIEKLIQDIQPKTHQKVFFSYYQYGYPYYFYDNTQRISLDKELNVILLSAIANTEYLLQFLDKTVATIHEIEYADHHVFDRHDLEKIIRVYQNMGEGRKIIMTTEKDAMRLEMHKDLLKNHNIPVFVLPAQVKFHFDEAKEFDTIVKDFLLKFEV